MSGITGALSSAGQRIAAIHREKKVLSEQPDQTLTTNQVEVLDQELAELQSKMQRLQLQQDVISLLAISHREVRRGRLGDEDSGGRSFTQVLKRLRKNISSENSFVIEQIDSVFSSYDEQTSEAQKISVEDTSDPKITLEIGATPQGSCQNFRNGVENRALLGYFDPNTKVLLVRNERGKPIARSIFRILDAVADTEVPEGSESTSGPVIQIETIYGVDAGEGVVRAIYDHAVAKSKQMGVPLVVSTKSQNAAGHMMESRVSDTVETAPLAAQLFARGSRAPYVYADSPGGSKKGGVYSFSDVNVVTK